MATSKSNPSKKNGYLSHILIIIIFIIVSCAFVYPYFQGKVLNQHDMLSWRYSSTYSMDYHKKTGKTAFWRPNSFSGFPAAFGYKLYTHSNWYHSLEKFIYPGKKGMPVNPAGYFFWAMICFYILMLSFGVNKWLSMFGAMAFAFSSYNPIIIAVGHSTKMQDIAFLPAVLAGVLLVYKRKYWLGIIITALFLTFFITVGHYQIIYYGAILIFVIGIAELVIFIKNKNIKQWLISSGILIVIACCAVLTKAVTLIPVQKYTAQSIRGGNSELQGEKHKKSGGLDKDYAFQWSNGIGETFCLLVPNLYGGSSGENIGLDSHYGKTLTSLGVPPQRVQQMTARAPLYWGPQPFLEGPIYFGAVICLLIVLSLMIIKSPLKWWLVGLALFFIVLSWGKHFSTFNYFLFDYLPFLDKFRTPSMALSIDSVLFPLLGIWALWDIFKGKVSKPELQKKLKISVGIVGGICVVIILGTYLFMSFKAASDAQLLQIGGKNNPGIGQKLVNAIHADRASATRTDAFRSLIFVLLSGGVLWVFSTGKFKKEVAIAGIGLLICFDEIPVANRYLNKRNFVSDYQYESNFRPTKANLKIMKDKDPAYRVMDLTSDPFNTTKASYFHRTVGGYTAVKLEIYQELIENQLKNLNGSVLNMLNTRYLIVPGKNNQPMVQKNPDACGPAWFVSDVKWATNAREAMDDLDAPSLRNPSAYKGKTIFKPLQTAVLRDSLKYRFQNFPIGKDSTANIKVLEYDPNKVVYETHNSQNGLAVFSEVYYPEGWVATIDGKPAHIMRTNFVLRALKVPAGKHKIVFKFTLPGFHEGETISYIGSILLTILILGSIVILVIKFRKEKEGKSIEQPKK